MRTVVVTGGSGKAGQAIIRDLIDHGYIVMNIDIAPPREPLCFFMRADLTNFGHTVDVFQQAAGTVNLRRMPLTKPFAVIHMAGIPGPSLAPDGEVFRNNLMSTHSVFSAATLFGIERIVWAASETAYGLPFTRSPPPSVPLLEDQPVAPETGYALAKVLAEDMAKHMHRWNPGTRFMNLRISNVFAPADYAAIPSFQDDIEIRKWNLWSWVDARDVAQACRLAIEVDIPGVDTITIAAADTVMNKPSRELMAEGFPGVAVDPGLSGHQTLQSIEKARRVLGYEPKYTWRNP